MKVIQIIGGGEKGGSKNHILSLTQELMNRNHTVEIICFLDDAVAQSAREAQLPVRIIPMKGILDIQVIRELSTYLKQEQPDIVHTHGVRANFIGRLASIRLNLPLLTTVHSSIYHDYAHPLKKILYHRIEKWTRRWTTQFIAVAGSLKQELMKDGITEERIEVVYNGLAPSFQSATVGEGRDEDVGLAIHEELGVDAQTPLILTIGRLERVKNQQGFLEILDQLRNLSVPYYACIVGDGPLRQELEQQISELQLDDHVRLLGFRRDIFALLAAADVFVLTSHMEGLPITLLEAMAAKTPVVVSKVGGMPEVISLAKNGYAVPPHDTEQFVARIQEILKQPERKAEMVECGYRVFQEQFTSDQFVSKTINVYNHTLNKHLQGLRNNKEEDRDEVDTKEGQE